MSDELVRIPPELLHAASDVTGRIALIVGAGCSLESPTNLELSSSYAQQVHAELIEDGVLIAGECSDPRDLSLIASVVHSKVGKQGDVVSRLPRGAFRDAEANQGYLISAALLLEGVVAAVLSLNYDLAMTDALGRVGAGDSVSVVADPESVSDLGSRVVVYLHRNVNESDFEKWVLRAEAIDDAWRGGWEEVIAQRVVTSPIVVFAGLGSPAAVLTETVRRIRQCLEGQGHEAFVVDPSVETPFKEALDLPEGAHIQMGWCAFMTCLASRLIIEQSKTLSEVARQLCTSNGWTDEVAGIDELCDLFFDRGLVASGFQRASWLLSDRKYLPDQDQVRELVAYLLLGVGIAGRRCGVTVNMRNDCVIELRRGGVVVGSILPISAGGTKHWTAMEPSIRRRLDKFSLYERPTSILLGSLQGAPPTQVSPPSDIVFDDDERNIVAPTLSPVYVSVDSLRSDEAIADRFVN